MGKLFIGLALICSSLSPAQEPVQKSVVQLLNLNGRQIVQIEQLYDYVNGIRYLEELPTKPVERSIERIRGAFESAQQEAKSLLSPGQKFLLERRAGEAKSAPELRHRLILVGTYEEFMAMPVDVEAAKRWLRARDDYERRLRRGLWFGYGLCGHHHWHGAGKPYCGNEFIGGGSPTRRGSAPGMPASRGGKSSPKSKSGR